MSAAKHTPGPWVVDPISDSTRFNLPRGTIYQVLSEAHKYPATICTIEEYREIGEPLDRAADAMLIAAAPELLDALKKIAKKNGVWSNGMWAVNIARAAIVKATGSEP